MKCISLVCTVHEKAGRANVPELSAILERIRPEVIFLEVPRGGLDQFFNACTEKDLEPNSVRQYHESYGAELVPVDLPTPESRFFTNFKNLQEVLRGKNLEIQRLLVWDKNHVCDDGFAYLNNELSSKMWTNIYAEMHAALRTIKDQGLTDFFELWNRTHKLRAIEMMKNILEYCGNNSFEKSLGNLHPHSFFQMFCYCNNCLRI